MIYQLYMLKIDYTNVFPYVHFISISHQWTGRVPTEVALSHLAKNIATF